MGVKEVVQVTCMAAAPILLMELLAIWRTYRQNSLNSTNTVKRPKQPKAEHKAAPSESSGDELVEDPVSSARTTRNSSIDPSGAATDTNNNKINKALFFPDDKRPPCTEHHFDGNCPKRQCFDSHDVDSSIGQLARYILLARDSIDVCQYSITSSFLTEAILRRHHLGVRVRVITDHEGANILSSQMEEFYKQGIQVRPHRGTGLMHHKFIVIDNKIVATGSFNYTAQATMENHENIIVSDNMDIVGRYVQNFDKLWKKFDYHPTKSEEKQPK